MSLVCSFWTRIIFCVFSWEPHLFCELRAFFLCCVPLCGFYLGLLFCFFPSLLVFFFLGVPLQSSLKLNSGQFVVFSIFLPLSAELHFCRSSFSFSEETEKSMKHPLYTLLTLRDCEMCCCVKSSASPFALARFSASPLFQYKKKTVDLEPSVYF